MSTEFIESKKNHGTTEKKLYLYSDGKSNGIYEARHFVLEVLDI